MTSNCSRRDFMKAAAAWATISVVPGRVLGADGQTPPSGKLNLAGVGVGGVGFGHLQDCEQAGFRIVALCDVDHGYAQRAFDRWPEARRYRDFREMFQAESDKIDAVYVATPDHNHAIVTLEALRRKKHVCCVKPLTRTVHEARVIVEATRKAGVATQVTASPNTSEGACRICELIGAGAIGAVREVHLWTNRPLWPQGMVRPPGEDPVPETLDWNLWIGPAPMRPFKNTWAEEDYAVLQVNLPEGRRPGARGVYHPWNFRGWWDFGTGVLGDMACHYMNTPFRALKLSHPVRVEATASKVFPETAPLASIVTYDFPARGALPPVRLVWYDGGLRPPTPRALQGRDIPDEGTLYIGDEGAMLGPKILGENGEARADAVPHKLPRRGQLWEEWIGACRGGEPAGCPFDWAGPLAETAQIGNIALRTGRPLDWDAAAMKFTNHDPANAFLSEPYHNGWTLAPPA
jgi:predicted dehydrogenase